MNDREKIGITLILLWLFWPKGATGQSQTTVTYTNPDTGETGLPVPGGGPMDQPVINPNPPQEPLQPYQDVVVSGVDPFWNDPTDPFMGGGGGISRSNPLGDLVL